jgi:hypothetical protein
LPYKPALDVDVQSSPGCDYRITRQVVDEARFIEPVASRNDIVVVGMLVAHLHQARRRMTIKRRDRQGDERLEEPAHRMLVRG